MRKKNSTEATVEKVELKTELDWLKPIEPKDVIDYTVDETAEPIKDQLEVLKILLKLNDYKGWVNKFLQGKKYQVLTDGDGKNYFFREWRLVNDIVYDIVNLMYGWKSAYVKRWDYVLYGDIEVRPYKIVVCTKYGNIELPALTVDGTTIYFKWNDCLSRDEMEAYKMYNQKTEDYNKLELEKKIMADLISYTQLGTKSIEDCGELVSRIKSSLESLGTVEYCGWKNGVMELKFPMRMGTDNDGEYHPMVLAPLTIWIDFRNRNIRMDGEHPHNLWGSPCLWWALSRLKDECFREKDIYGLVIGMAQFWNSFTSTDCGHWDRDPSKKLIRYLSNFSFDTILSWDKVPFVEIFRTVAFYDINWFTYRYPEFVEKCKDFEFVKPLLSVLSPENKSRFLQALGYTSAEAKEIIEKWAFPEKETTIKTGIRADGWYFGPDEDDYEEEDYDEEEDE